MTVNWDREPTSDAERALWRVGEVLGVTVWTDDAERRLVATFATPELAAQAVWEHGVMHAAREQRALGVGLHDGCVPKERLVQVGWRMSDDGLHDDGHSPSEAFGDLSDYWPVYVLRPDEATP